MNQLGAILYSLYHRCLSVYLHWRYQLLLLFFFTLSIVIKFIVMSSFLYLFVSISVFCFISTYFNSSFLFLFFTLPSDPRGLNYVKLSICELNIP